MKKIISLLVFVNVCVLLQGQDFALKQLEDSPRHHEWKMVDNGDRQIKCFVAFPEVSEKSLVAIVIHENRGLTDWVRSFADQLAEAGYIAVAPDLLSDFSKEYKATKDFASSDAARDAIYQLEPEQVKLDLNAVQDYAESIPAGNGKTASIGFCWGGSQSFRMATYNDELAAALVFYGSAPDSKEEIEKISAPVFGFYGGDDNRINTQIPATEEMMKKAGKTYKYEIYDGAGHAYMRRGDNPDVSDANTEARNKSWDRLKKILAGL